MIAFLESITVGITVGEGGKKHPANKVEAAGAHRVLRRALTAASLAVALAAALGACAPHNAIEPCGTGQISRLYLGKRTPDGPVSDVQWQRFIDEAATPMFPNGFTVLDAQGQWRNADGLLEREATRVLEIVHDQNPFTRERVHALANDYKRRFNQRSVLVAQVPSYQCF
jgi:Protein of unknown function (DUF3574)